MGSRGSRGGARPRRGLLYRATSVFSIGVGFTIILAAVAVLSGSDAWRELGARFVMIAALVLLSELRPIVMSRYDGETVSLSQALAFAALYLWGWEAAVVLIAAGTLTSELLERKAPFKVLFNVGQYAVNMMAAWLVLWAGSHLDAVGSLGTAGAKTELGLGALVVIALSWVAYHLANLAQVAGLAEDGDWWASFRKDFWFYTTSTFAVLALSPLVAVVAVAYPRSWLLLPLLMLPLFAVQRTAQMAQEREHRALHDPLTGLPNRLLLTDRIESALERTSRSGGRVVVIFLDLDLFKTINDGLGHAVGDAVLVDVSDRLAEVLPPGDTLARFSGDEFAMVCEGIPDDQIAVLAASIQAALEPPFTFGSHEVTVTASIGVATATPYSTAQSLLREADSAMYRAKTAGRDQVAHFHSSMLQAATARLDDQLGLRRALERDELRAHYQPVIDLTTGEVVGMEALVRWRHPERGLIGPDQFIPLAEETGLILPLGAWVLDEGLRQLNHWHEELGGSPELWVAVNLSPRQLSDPDLTHKVARSLRESGVAPHLLHLEITETAVMRSADRSSATLEALRGLGVRLIIDDFGTGYSSLARLKRLPVTTLKIDRTFIDGLDAGSSDRSIVDAIAQMAHSLNLEVIAEGVETIEQLRILQTLGVRMGQGYLWSRPLPASDVAEWVGEVLTPVELSRFRALLRQA
jgi:diguanylate cyclase (GGDEF)-like protein